MIEMDFSNETIKAAPIVGTAGADIASRLFLGLSLYEWFYVAAIAWTLLQIAGKGVDMYLKIKESKRNRENGGTNSVK